MENLAKSLMSLNFAHELREQSKEEWMERKKLPQKWLGA
jgi:hypothetical protein